MTTTILLFLLILILLIIFCIALGIELEETKYFNMPFILLILIALITMWYKPFILLGRLLYKLYRKSF